MVVEGLDDAWVDDDEVDLRVTVERAGVEVGGADIGDDPVDGHDLGVEHRGLEVVQLDAAGVEPLVVRLGAELYEALVGEWTGKQDLDVHAPLCRLAETAAEVVIG